MDSRLHSVATIPALGSTVVALLAVREEVSSDGATRYGDDWLDLALPLGALGRLDERVGGYPFGATRDSRTWREAIEAWFTGIARAVFDACGFVHAATGFEVFGDDVADTGSDRVGWFARSESGLLIIEPVTEW